MGVGILMTLAILAAITSAGVRRWKRGRVGRSGPGSSEERAIIVRRFDEIDDALGMRACAWCAGSLRLAGETSRSGSGRQIRVARLVCMDCDRESRVYFDVTRVFH